MPVSAAASAGRWDREADIVVVGSGAAALSAALAAAVGGAKVIILEKAAALGGTTAMSGAGTWVPANHHMLAAGIADSKAEALTYLRAAAPPGWRGDRGPAVAGLRRGRTRHARLPRGP